MSKDFKPATERFNKSAELAFQKGFDRFAVSALEYVLDCYKGLKKGKSKEALKLQKKIKETKAKLASQLF